MPSFDVTRSRFRLTDDQVFVLAQLATGQPVPESMAPAEARLRDAGLTNGAGELSALLLPLMRTLVQPSVIVSLEAGGRQGTLHHGLLIGDDHVVCHETWPGEEEAEYRLVEPRTVVWTLADLIALRQSDRFDRSTGATGATGAGSEKADEVVETTIGVLEAGLAALEKAASTPGTDERALVVEALREAGAAEDTATRLSQLIVEVRSNWRMTAAWQGRQDGVPGVAARAVAAWDCGPLGHWLRELPAEPMAEGGAEGGSPFRLRRVAPKRIWQELTGLLPDAAELVREQAAPEA
ncbi:histidine kinase [Streptomyces sp. NBC_01077]|uniref:histidine kinase n=1 Tax=Streptomyces sp. NBC_01077 TaxID=2903746 RepID=UPI0038635ECD|nr:histidine kinase [Streptomyces sp. NBC_01077]